MAGTMKFKSAAAYKKWVAYAKIHGKPSKSGPKKVKIGGKTHKVDHSSRKRKK